MMKKVDIIICWMYVEVEEENDIYNFIYILVLIKWLDCVKNVIYILYSEEKIR